MQNKKDIKFGESVKFGFTSEVIDNLLKLREQLICSEFEIPVSNPNDYIGFSLKKIIDYCSVQIERYVSQIDSPIEFHAWIARNLFESYLICEYIKSSSIKAKEFIAQKGIDELHIHEGILTLMNSETPPGFEQEIKQRNDHLRKTITKHGMKESPNWSVSKLAKATGNKDEYEAFFKLYSKYVHPSAWIIFGVKNEYDSDIYKNIFLLQAQFYASRILKIAEDYKTGNKF